MAGTDKGQLQELESLIRNDTLGEDRRLRLISNLGRSSPEAKDDGAMMQILLDARTNIIDQAMFNHANDVKDMKSVILCIVHDNVKCLRLLMDHGLCEYSKVNDLLFASISYSAINCIEYLGQKLDKESVFRKELLSLACEKGIRQVKALLINGFRFRQEYLESNTDILGKFYNMADFPPEGEDSQCCAQFTRIILQECGENQCLQTAVTSSALINLLLRPFRERMDKGKVLISPDSELVYLDIQATIDVLLDYKPKLPCEVVDSCVILFLEELRTNLSIPLKSCSKGQEMLLAWQFLIFLIHRGCQITEEIVLYIIKQFWEIMNSCSTEKQILLSIVIVDMMRAIMSRQNASEKIHTFRDVLRLIMSMLDFRQHRILFVALYTRTLSFCHEREFGSDRILFEDESRSHFQHLVCETSSFFARFRSSDDSLHLAMIVMLCHLGFNHDDEEQQVQEFHKLWGLLGRWFKYTFAAVVCCDCDGVYTFSPRNVARCFTVRHLLLSMRIPLRRQAMVIVLKSTEPDVINSVLDFLGDGWSLREQCILNIRNIVRSRHSICFGHKDRFIKLTNKADKECEFEDVTGRAASMGLYVDHDHCFIKRVDLLPLPQKLKACINGTNELKFSLSNIFGIQ